MTLMVSALLAILLSVTIAPAQPKREMMKVPLGTFISFYSTGSKSDTTDVKAFQMDVTAVTNEQYLEFVRANPEWRRSKVKRLFADASYLQKWESDTTIGMRVAPNSPVTNVSWFAAKAYCKWAGTELPTIAEWELAAASPPRGKTREQLTQLILDWYSRPNPKVVPPVRTTFKNALGIYDMHGLIWEWTSDFNTVLLSDDDRSAGADNRLYCGGGVINSKDFENYAAYMRYALRSSLKARSTLQTLGFRTIRRSK